MQKRQGLVCHVEQTLIIFFCASFFRAWPACFDNAAAADDDRDETEIDGTTARSRSGIAVR